MIVDSGMVVQVGTALSMLSQSVLQKVHDHDRLDSEFETSLDYIA